MVAYTFYESDNRVRRYAETLAGRGDHVEVVALRRRGQSPYDIINGVKLFRIQYRTVTEKNKLAYLGKLFLFFVRSMAFLTRGQIRSRYDLIHVHSVPDFEVFAAAYPKLTGTKIILDIHDIVPEFYASKFSASRKSLPFRMLVGVERLSIGFSDHVIAANHIWEKRLLARSVRGLDCTTFLNYPDTQVFHRRGRTRNDGKFILLYPGTLNYHQGLDIAVRAFSTVANQIRNAELHIYGAGDQLDSLKALVAELALGDRVFLKPMLPLHEISAVIENSDLGIVPKRGDGFGNEAFSTKILEFMALGVPVVIPATAVDRYYFNDSIAKFFRPNDEKSLTEAILQVISQPELRRSLTDNANKFIAEYTWERNKHRYLTLVDSLVNSLK